MPTDDGDQPPTYQILDCEGRPIGRVRVAEGGMPLPLGRGAGTVLLIRDRRTGASGAGLPGSSTGCRG
ncbi:MAG: hypothetical protein ACM3NS_07955 [Deltaproteobacteria bacterium]